MVLPWLGIGLGLLSAMCFGTSGTFGAALEGAGWSPAGAVLARVTVAALALTVPALDRRSVRDAVRIRTGLRDSVV